MRVAVLNGLLNNSASVAVFRKVDQLDLNGIKKLFLLFFSAFLKDLLEDIVAESVFHKGFVFFENKGKNEFLCVFLASFKDVLYGPRPVLVPGPFSDLRKIVYQLLFWAYCWVVALVGHVDHLVTHVVFVLETQSKFIWRFYFLVELEGGE